MLPFSTRLHAILDYFFGVFLMVAPALIGFGNADIETVIPILAGMTICFYSFFSKYEGGISPIFPMKVHYIFDLIIGIFVASSPWVFGFRDIVYKPHFLIGFAFILVAIYWLFPLVKLQKFRIPKLLGDIIGLHSARTIK